MIIQAILASGFLVCLVYAFFQWHRSRLFSVIMLSTSIIGIYCVFFPQRTTDVARLLGVGRGTDLVLYCWLLVSLLVSVNLWLKLLALQEAVTELTRELALRAPQILPDYHVTLMGNPWQEHQEDKRQ